MVRGCHLFEERDRVIKERFKSEEAQPYHPILIGDDIDEKFCVDIRVPSRPFPDKTKPSVAVQLDFRFGKFLIVLKLALKLCFGEDAIGSQTPAVQFRSNHQEMCLI